MNGFKDLYRKQKLSPPYEGGEQGEVRKQKFCYPPYEGGDKREVFWIWQTYSIRENI